VDPDLRRRLLRPASSPSAPCASGCHCGQPVQLGFRDQDLRQLVQLGLLSATVPLVCLVSGLLFFLIFIEFNMTTNAIVVNITLDGQNYPEWAFCVETALGGHGYSFI
jgi:hypothetical protein